MKFTVPGTFVTVCHGTHCSDHGWTMKLDHFWTVEGRFFAWSGLDERLAERRLRHHRRARAGKLDRFWTVLV